MKRIKTSLENVLEDIKAFYEPKRDHFLTLNGVALDQNSIEVQWIFSHYHTKDEIVLFHAIATETQTIPSITEIIPSAIISQRELVDMFGVKVEESERGLYLDEDSLEKPLSLECTI
jgi:NADH:ubiquinone oxidoreductase subunit C